MRDLKAEQRQIDLEKVNMVVVELHPNKLQKYPRLGKVTLSLQATQ